MSLAFFYLVIGDLITFHQKAIFNFDAFAGQPLNKPDKSDKGSIYKLKDKKDRILANFLTFVSSPIEIGYEVYLGSVLIIESTHIGEILLDQLVSGLSFRGPPSSF